MNKLQVGMIVGVSLVLAGCLTPIELYSDTCSGYEFKTGTNAFANCIQQEVKTAAEDRQELREILRSYTKSRCENLANANASTGGVMLKSPVVVNC